MSDGLTYSTEIPKEKEVEELDIKIDKRSSVPIFVQLQNHFKYLVATGHISPGERLPSVRKLAKALEINPNTVDRAYVTLEQEGFISIEKGRGTFVKDVADHLPLEESKKQFESLAKEFINSAFKLGFKPDQIIAEIQKLMPSE